MVSLSLCWAPHHSFLEPMQLTRDGASFSASRLGIALRHQQDIRRLPRPQTSAWPWRITRATGINTASGHIWTTDPLMALSGCMDIGPHLGLKWTQVTHISMPAPRQQSPRASPNHQAVAQTAYIHTDLRLHHGLGQQHGPQAPAWPLVASQTPVVLPGGIV